MTNGLLSLVALVAGVVLLGVVVSFTGDQTWFINPAGIAITLGGLTVTSVIMFSVAELLEAAGTFLNISVRKPPVARELYQDIVAISRRARREGRGVIGGAEARNDAERFLAAGLELVRHGVEPALIREVLVARANAYFGKMRRIERVYQHLGTVSPMFGLVGTVIGLILMLNNVSNAEEVPRNMAVALVTTFYGISLAALVFNPIAGRIRAYTDRQVQIREMVLIGVLALEAGNPTRVVEEKLGPYLD